MARIEHIRLRLENWARWSAKRDSRSLGYPSQSAFARMRASSASRDSHIPVSDLDACEIDDAVRSLQLTRSHLYLTLTLHYARGLPLHQVASRMGKATSTIKHNLQLADHAIDLWLQAKREHRLPNVMTEGLQSHRATAADDNNPTS